MSDRCEICHDPMTEDVCQTCGVRLCPRHRNAWLGEDLRGLWCNACWREMYDARKALPTPNRDEARAHLIAYFRHRSAIFGWTPKEAADSVRGQHGGHWTPGGIGYSYGGSSIYHNRKKVSLKPNSLVVEHVHGTDCFEIFALAEIEQALDDALNPQAAKPQQLVMFL